MIRKAQKEDIPRIFEIYSFAREYMKKIGNPNQWGDIHPPKDLVLFHFEKSELYVDEIDGVVEGVFALIFGNDETYSYIENGKWPNNEKYATMHMVASSCNVKGAFKRFCNYAKGRTDNLRIDTHIENKVMINCITKNGFVHCGRIYLSNGSPREAYHWTKNK